MLIPIRTDRYAKKRPLITPLLIGANVAIHLLAQVGEVMGWFTVEQFLGATAFDPLAFKWWQLLTCAFVHDPGGIWHIAFNMLFLWVFGIAVESRLGRIGFTAFYLIGAAAASLGHMLVSDSPVIGASGAVSGVVGAFLALFPRSHIIMLFLFTMSFVRVPAAWFIALYFLIDVLNQFTAAFGLGYARVAYMAHLTGYVYGFFVCFALLGLGILKREEFDVFFLFKQARRRAAFRAASRGSASGLWDSATRDTTDRMARQARKKPQVLDEQTKEIAEKRAEISRVIAANDLPAAADKYRWLLRDHPDSVMDESRQLDLANQLYAKADFKTAAEAYELFLKHYPRSAKADEVRLLLSVCYARRLGRPERAKALLEEARPRLIDAAHSTLAAQLLAELSP